MEMVSYWKDHKEIYSDGEFILIIGKYNHKDVNKEGEKSLGVHWGGNYPSPHGKLCPCVIPNETRGAILSGLLHQAVKKNDQDLIKRIIGAIEYLK